jgi:hypothetical protein
LDIRQQETHPIRIFRQSKSPCTLKLRSMRRTGKTRLSWCPVFARSVKPQIPIQLCGVSWMPSCGSRLHTSSSEPFVDTSNQDLANTRHLLPSTPALLQIFQRTIIESPLRQPEVFHLSLFRIPRHDRLQVSDLPQLHLYRSTCKDRHHT